MIDELRYAIGSAQLLAQTLKKAIRQLDSDEQLDELHLERKGDSIEASAVITKDSGDEVHRQDVSLTFSAEEVGGDE